MLGPGSRPISLREREISRATTRSIDHTNRLPAMRRAASHARVGSRLEAAWGERLDAIAAELAEHFERGNEQLRAIPHHQRAAAKALRRSATAEASEHLRRALDAHRGRGRARQDRGRTARCPGRCVHNDAWIWRAGSARCLLPRGGALRSPGRARRSLSCDLGPVDVPHRPGRDECGAAAGRETACAKPCFPRSGAFRWNHHGHFRFAYRVLRFAPLWVGAGRGGPGYTTSPGPSLERGRPQVALTC
jgi:hypothetical protein